MLIFIAVARPVMFTELRCLAFNRTNVIWPLHCNRYDPIGRIANYISIKRQPFGCLFCMQKIIDLPTGLVV